MSSDTCILCFETLSKPTDRNLVEGKGNVKAELNNLPFVVLASSSYICKSCLGLIKKRRGLKKKLSQLDGNLIILYKAKVQDFGSLLKRKQISPKKLKFDAVADQNGGLSYVNYSVAESSKDSCFGTDVKTTLSR